MLAKLSSNQDENLSSFFQALAMVNYQFLIVFENHDLFPGDSLYYQRSYFFY